MFIWLSVALDRHVLIVWDMLSAAPDMVGIIAINKTPSAPGNKGPTDNLT